MTYKQLSQQGVYSMSATLLNEDERYYYVEIRAMKSGVNRNNWDFTLEGIKKNGKTFAGQPLLIAYVGEKIGDGHNFEYEYDPITGALTPDFRGADAERIVGEILDDIKVEEVVEMNNESWLILPARIWKYYAQQLVDYLAENKVMDVSVEVEVEDNYEVREDGVEVFTEWTGLGVTILGQGVTPAIEGARLRALAMSDEYKKMRTLAASYNGKSNSNKGGRVIMNETLKKALASALAEQGTFLGFSADDKYASVFRKNGVPAFYPCAEYNEADGIVASKFIDARLVMSADIVNGEETETVTCNAANILDAANAEAETAKAEVEKAKKECEQAKQDYEKASARVAELEKAESDRKLAEMTKAFDDAVKAHNLTASQAEQITDEEINVVHNSINEGKIADADSAIGEFKKLAYDKHVAAQKKDDKKFAWNNIHVNAAATGEEAIIAKYSARGNK